MGKQVRRIKIKFKQRRTIVEAHSQSPRGSSFLVGSGSFISDDPRHPEEKAVVAAAIANLMDSDSNVL